jgi:hypothetical protein
LRAERGLTIDEIADRLGVSRTTAFYWVGDMARPPGCVARTALDHKVGNRAMQAKYRRLREEAREKGRREFNSLAKDPLFRDFVTLYIAEGSKRSRNVVAVANSDPAVVSLCARWIRHFSRNKIGYAVQYHADQDLKKLKRYWADQLEMEPTGIKALRKSNSSGLAARTWRSRYGVLTVRVGDTLLRSRLQGWMDSIENQWLDSPSSGRSSVW